MTACIGQPISWLRLETFALGAPDPAIASHLAACPVCRRCLDEIRSDVVALPPLELPAVRAAPIRAARWWLVPAFAAAVAAVVVLIVVLRPAPSGEAASAMVAVKGVGDVTLELVRNRDGEVSYGAARYAPGDRWKVVVTCRPSASARIDVSVSDGATTDHPLAPAQVPCGNRVVVPGAFQITGTSAHRVCASITAEPGAEAAVACLTLHPE